MLAGTVVLLVLAIGVLAFVLYPLWVASRRSVSPSPFPLVSSISWPNAMRFSRHCAICS